MTQAKLFPALALLSTLAGLVPQPVEAADIFYTRLLERGVRDLELGLTDEAQKKLRTACFGFLEEPVLLAEGLMQLGRAQSQAGNGADLTETVERLVEIEDRFDAYSSFNGDLKAVFESSLRRALPGALLERMPMFTHLTVATEPAVNRIKAQTPKQRRKALEQRLVANPNDAETLLALAQMHHLGGKLKPASQLLDRLLEAQPEHEQALCLRADIAIDKRECPPALAGLDRCAPLTASNQAAAFVLECLVSAQRTADAEALLDALPIDRRRAPLIDRAARKIKKSSTGPKVPADSPSAPETAPAEATVLPPESAAAQEAALEIGNEFPEITIGLTLEERIRRLREEVVQSRFREQLEGAMQRAAELASDYPDSKQALHLAAEVAYLSSEWQSVVDYFARGGRPSADQPELLFYLAVATYELGFVQEADSILREALPELPRNPFVDSYVDKILISPRS